APNDGASGHVDDDAFVPVVGDSVVHQRDGVGTTVAQDASAPVVVNVGVLDGHVLSFELDPARAVARDQPVRIGRVGETVVVDLGAVDHQPARGLSDASY